MIPALRKYRPVLFIGFVWLGIWVTYFPSLSQLPRSDQLCYLLDTSSARTFGELLAQSYSYNRTRQIGPGDTDLFRPILFGMLALEKTWFENNFVLYQAVGLTLHCLIVSLFFLILLQLDRRRPWCSKSSLLAYPVTLFFAVNFSISELVMWHHLHGYMLFLLFVLASFSSLLIAQTHPNRLRQVCWLIGAWILAALAVFTYELGQFYAILAGLFLAIVGPGTWKSRIGCLAAFGAGIVILYQAVNSLDYHYHEGQFVPDNHLPTVLKEAWTEATLQHTGRLLSYVLFQPFCPTDADHEYYYGRLNIREQPFSWDDPFAWTQGPFLVFLLLTLLAAGGMLWRRRWACLPLLIVPCGLFASYVAMIVLGRMNLRPGDILAVNCYYPYIPLPLFLMAVHVLWGCLDYSSRTLQAVTALTMASLLVVTGLSAQKIYEVSCEIREIEATVREQLCAVDEFVRQHSDEPDFGLKFDFSSQTYPTLPGLPLPQILFHKWLVDAPKYVVYIDEEQQTNFLTAEEYYLMQRKKEQGEAAPSN